MGGAGMVLFYSLEMVPNSVLGLGQPVDKASLAGQAAMARSGLLIMSMMMTFLVNPFLGLTLASGKEYGWRGYL